MSTAVLIQTEGGVMAAWDSQATFGDGEAIIIEENKVFRNGKLVFAVAGTLTGLIAIKHAKLNPYNKKDDKKDYLVNSLIPELREALKDAGEVEGDAGNFEMDVVVGVDGELFDLRGISSKTYFQRVDGRYCIGSGSPYAQGALAAGASLRVAVDIAKTYDTFTGGEVREALFSW